MRYIKKEGYDQNRLYVVIAGKSTDDKPKGNFITGSLFIEGDTGKVYFYDEEVDNWIEFGGGANNG